MRISEFAKAVVAALAAGAAAAGTAVQDGVVTSGEGIGVVLAVLGALGITYWVPNREPKDPS
ncbi:putative membrane protein [Streptomyces scabiei 87.22]|uniref:Putative membrane protein n=1 Tax=Streptomyces scabiei (strain 87.22) TaxID=680198 RepID=C9Z963_STRSW|nr:MULTISPECIES: hypothetical protein [Streptomyces]MBP5875643.1 hypothetical protein [Streptomyces sp. LBUM 1477]MDX2652098.1 hypothetical protein [Streptomyces scabiei]MDX2725876.1 hypothetical protein [Streptomyces scabiei]MDX2863995.1 hypothetical protein [Streptomyces scabiei]MDX2881919.1 hypothetical protein [Streptomyces scabiei]